MAVMKRARVDEQQQKKKSLSKRSWAATIEFCNKKRKLMRTPTVPVECEAVTLNSSSPSSFTMGYRKYFTQFNPSSSSYVAATKTSDQDEFTLLAFDDEEYEIGYTMLRQREKKLILHDHVFQYTKLPEYGGIVLQQRNVMVDWMTAAYRRHSLQYETLFSGVSLLDRFLARGYFKSKSCMQVLGIACLMLATRIEENQSSLAMIEEPFFVGENAYSYLEAVGMMWLVQEVLEYHCLVPTIYNFLEYYLIAGKADMELQELARNLAMLSLIDHRRLWYSPSTVAAGLVIIASIALNREASWQSVIKTHLRSSKDQLQICIASLEVCLDKYFRLDVLFRETEAFVLLSSLMNSAASMACNEYIDC